MRLILSALITAVAVPAFAADLGTYRPGTPYHSTQVPGADVCESTCAGDAQCRGWNYVKPAPQAPGVCELQSRVGAPVSSAISISGVKGGASALPANVIAGDTNTIRVGTTTASAAAPMAMRTQTGRRVVRQPVPQQRQVQPTSLQRQPVPQQRRALQPGMQPRAPQPAPQPRPQFTPMLDGAVAARPMPQRAPQGPMMPNGQRMLQPVQPAPMAGQAPRGPQARGPARRRDARSAGPRAQAPQGRPPIGQPIAPQPQAPQFRAPTAPPPSTAMMQTRSAAQPMTFEQAQMQAEASLYGNLNDDVRMPAANAAIPADPNAPIPTMQRRPVAPVAVEELAGAMPR